jgi:biopolymer transport protein ExbD
MKIKYLLIIPLLISFTTFAQKVEVPKEAKDSFAKLYPKAKEIKWDKEGKDYEASFKLDKKEMSVNLDAKGNLLDTETKIEKSQLPEGVEKYVNDNYKGFKISEAAKIVKADGKIIYEAEVTKQKEKKDLLFDANGKPIKKEMKMEDDEDKED